MPVSGVAVRAGGPRGGPAPARARRGVSLLGWRGRGLGGREVSGGDAYLGGQVSGQLRGGAGARGDVRACRAGLFEYLTADAAGRCEDREFHRALLPGIVVSVLQNT